MEWFDDGFGQGAWRRPRERRLAHQQRIDHTRQHEQRGNAKHALPWHMVRQYQRQRPWYQARNAVRLHVYRIAKAKLDLRQQLATISVKDDVLGSGEEGNGSGKVGDGP